MNQSPSNSAPAAHEPVAVRRPSKEALLSRAAFYGLVLRQRGYAPDEAAVLVMQRYPQARPLLEKLTRPRVVDPLIDFRKET